MTDDVPVSPYCCAACDAQGELTLIEGETVCPACGDHLWTVRPPREKEPPARLIPDDGLPLLPDRPPLDTRRLSWVGLGTFLLRPLIILWLIPRQRIMVSRVGAKLDAIAGCRRREDLERILGPPVYAIEGSRLETDDSAEPFDRPDLIECYESEGCCIDLWFKNDRLVDTSGFVKPTLWDVILARQSKTPDER